LFDMKMKKRSSKEKGVGFEIRQTFSLMLLNPIKPIYLDLV